MTRPACLSGHTGEMVTHVWYRCSHHTDAGTCLLDIRDRLEQGWRVVQIRGGKKGPFLVVYRRDSEDG